MSFVSIMTAEALAGAALSIAESRSLEALGAACAGAIGALTGSSAVGFYLLDEARPDLVYCRDVPDGFIREYGDGYCLVDPLLHSLVSDRRIVDGVSLVGASRWRRSLSYALLERWGFSHNMCGPVCIGDRVAGVVYTATTAEATPYTPAVRERMAILCRAGSLALASMAAEGRLAHVPWRPPASEPDEDLCERLPPRAAAVARRVCRGHSNKLIARELGISDQTVKEHVATLCRRLGARNRTELAARLAGRPPGMPAVSPAGRP